MSVPDERGGSWTLLTGHGHVLAEIARTPTARIRAISAAVGLTERTVQVIVMTNRRAISPHRTGRAPVPREPRLPPGAPPRKDFRVGPSDLLAANGNPTTARPDDG
jgi:hypothetical protein